MAKATREQTQEQYEIFNREVRPLDVLNADTTKPSIYLLPKTSVVVDGLSTHMKDLEKAGILLISKK